MSHRKKVICIGLVVILLATTLYWSVTHLNINPHFEVGQKIDSIDGVYVYYNGGVNHSNGRNTSSDGYNIGIKYQCVEFIKRFYYEYYHHKMRDTYGNAKDFFDDTLKDNSWNEKRGLTQFTNGSTTYPQKGDIIVFKEWVANPYGHVAIVSATTDKDIEIIQQNPGPFAKSRERFLVTFANDRHTIQNSRIKGWLRIRPQNTNIQKINMNTTAEGRRLSDPLRN